MSEAEVEQEGLAIEHPQGRRSEPVVTYTIIAINVIVFVAMCVKGVPFMHPTTQDVIPWGASYGPLTVGGQWWRLFTEIFVHFGILHIGMNMYILFQVGVLTELLFGKVRYIILYLAAGLAGSLTSLYVHPLGVSAGASGAIFGVFGALLAFLLIERGVIPRKAAMQIARSAVFFLAYHLIYGSGRSADDGPFGTHRRAGDGVCGGLRAVAASANNRAGKDAGRTDRYGDRCDVRPCFRRVSIHP